jgi:Pectinacetylesterase
VIGVTERRATRCRVLALSVLVAASTAIVAGCGGSEDSEESGASANSDRLVAYSQCMREHGVPEFPDPANGQIRITGEREFDPTTPEFQAAERACQNLLPPGPNPGDAAPSGTASRADQEWTRVVPGGDCECSDGSKFAFWVRRANPKKVVFYLQGGGACFSPKTCARDSDLYAPNLRSAAAPTEQEGMFDLAEKRNPFSDYSIVYVPYCTGDAHMGDTTRRYAPGLIVRHKGYVNGTAALEYLGANFPDVTKVAVMGESAGSVAAPFYAGLVSDQLPEAHITVIADGSGSFPDAPGFNNLGVAWRTGNTLPDWAAGPYRSANHWSFPGLFIQAARHSPKIVFARHDHAYDETQELWYPLVGLPAKDLLSLIDANETQI